MGRELRQWPALTLALIALLAALGGGAYAAKKATKIDGKKIRVKSLPGNRLKPASLPANRLQPGAIPGDRLAPNSITGVQIDAATLGTVPSAVHASTADSARDAETALHAVNAVTAGKVNGYSAGCLPSDRLFAGSCWDAAPSESALNAPAAAAACAAAGAELPSALLLAAFAAQPGIGLASEEWTGDITNVSGVNQYAVVTISAAAQLSSDLPTATKKFRCVTPLLS
ncbi:MAG TPA: hypothetical protein VK889_07785 [Solirubrobacterales bacterium]|nr:hypothetical protein [Solirubrobacterales bacterium]